MRNPAPPNAEVEALEREAMRALQSGREADAIRHWNRILEIHPTHLPALGALAQRAFQRGDMQGARAAFQRVVDADGTVAQQWIHLAIACRNLYDDQAADAAIESALAVDPHELVALILRANSLERRGRTHEAAAAYGAVAATAPPLQQLRP